MKDVDKIPVHIISSYFSICTAFVKVEDTGVILLGMYQDVLSGDCETIMMETDFETFNQLLTIAGEQDSEKADRIIAMISDRLSMATQEDQVIALEDVGELDYPNHIFSFTLLLDEDEDLDALKEDNIYYQLNGFMPAKEILEFYDLPLPEADDEEKLSYYHKLLAVRYRFFQMHLKHMRHSKAVRLANLMDPVVFRLAELQYKMMMKEDRQAE